MERESWIIALELEMVRINNAYELERHCIYRVPKFLRDSGDAYTPQLVSFGPYHHHQDHLKQMEKHKHIALWNYLRRANTTVEAVVETMRLEVKSLMESYDELEEEWMDEVKFLKLMILDGCFFLDVMIWRSVVFQKQYMFTRLHTDMLLDENQLPLAVLALLIEMGGNKVEDTKKFIEFHQDFPERRESIRGMGFHHLDIHWKGVVMEGCYFYDPYCIVRSATELFEAGVRFVRSGTDRLNDISFYDGTLTLPSLKIHDSSETWLLNYITYEHVRNVKECGVTSYALLMGDLINNGKDATMLRERRIIKGYVGNDDEIASLFNRLVKAITFTRGEGRVNVNENLENYCYNMSHRWRASFVQTYMSNCWFFILVGGALMLLVLTVLQTVYRVIAYYHRS